MTVVSLWFVIPIAFKHPSKLMPSPLALAIAPSIDFRTVSRISIGSCSTHLHPGIIIITFNTFFIINQNLTIKLSLTNRTKATHARVHDFRKLECVCWSSVYFCWQIIVCDAWSYWVQLKCVFWQKQYVTLFTAVTFYFEPQIKKIKINITG